MNFQDIQNDLYDRGLAYLNDGGRGVQRIARWVNAAYKELNDADDWPYLRATATGAAPLLIADLGIIESVINQSTQTKLTPVDYRSLSDYFPLTTLPGTGQFYYIPDGQTITVYPVDTSTLTVTYWKDAADLSLGSDVPIVPTNFHELIVLGALRRGFLEDTDAGDAQLVQQEYDRNLTWMRSSLIDPQADKPQFIAQTAPHEGY